MSDSIETRIIMQTLEHTINFAESHSDSCAAGQALEGWNNCETDYDGNRTNADVKECAASAIQFLTNNDWSEISDHSRQWICAFIRSVSSSHGNPRVQNLEDLDEDSHLGGECGGWANY